MKIKKQAIQLIIVAIVAFCGYFFVNEDDFASGIVPVNNVQKTNLKEKDYVNMHCKGTIEYVLPDKTRIDCLTDEYAIEYDWASKWAESIGQSLYYAKMTGHKPAVAIIMKTPQDEKYIKRIQTADERITVFKIKAYELPQGFWH